MHGILATQPMPLSLAPPWPALTWYAQKIVSEVLVSLLSLLGFRSLNNFARQLVDLTLSTLWPFKVVVEMKKER